MGTIEPKGIRRAIPSVELLPVQLDGRLVGHLTVEEVGERDEWEMHPHQDEMLYLIEGAIDVFLRADPDEEREKIRHVNQGEACIIPKGMWHRQVVVAPCKVLFLTPETVHRSYSPKSGWIDDHGGRGDPELSDRKE
jgi:mannose-6-phosphate isomerase-like protein (cupin superfamily)